MSNRQTYEQTVNAYFDGINSENYSAVAALFAPDGELTAPGTAVRRGADDIEAYFTAALGPYPEHFDDPTRLIHAGATITVEIHFTGRLATGGRLEFDAIDVFDLDNEGRITRLSSWYDSHAIRTELRRMRKEGSGD